MKTLRYIGMVILAVVLCVNLAACSDDDDEAGADTSLIGTTWRITASNEDKEIHLYLSREVLSFYAPMSHWRQSS
ncbi:MAG: hypothetical protein ACI4A7_05230 [Prevotella sp.]